MNKIQLPIEMFSKGSVIFIDFVYDDKPEKSKERPAIVTDYNEEETRVVLLKVTSRETRSKYDYLISNPEIADLKAGSVVRCNHILTVPNNYRCSKHGDLSRKDLMAVEILYNQAIIDNSIVKSGL